MSEGVSRAFYLDGEQWKFGPYPGTNGIVIIRREGETLEEIAEGNGFPLDVVKAAFGEAEVKQLRDEADAVEADVAKAKTKKSKKGGK